MKYCYYIILMLLLLGCIPQNKPTKPAEGLQADSIYTIADIRHYGDYYQSGHHVYAVDLLSDGLQYDSLGYITGTGYNLYLSDVFTGLADSLGLPAGSYEMDSVAREGTFLRGMDFDGNITGCYLLEISNDQLKRIVLFTSGSMQVAYEGEEIILDLTLYTADSLQYNVMYLGK